MAEEVDSNQNQEVGTMRKAAAVLAVLLMGTVAQAGPRVLSFQGSLTDGTGNPVADGSYDMRFSVYKEAVGGTSAWNETHAAVEVQNGVYSVLLGETTLFSPSLFSNDYTLWLAVEVDLAGDGFDANDLYSPRQQIASAAWAVDADRLAGRSSGDFQLRVTGSAPAGEYITAIAADGTVVTSPLPAGGVTLDGAYDFGGPGAGRNIAADSGAVNITGSSGLVVEPRAWISDGTNLEIELSSQNNGSRITLGDGSDTLVRLMAKHTSSNGGGLVLSNALGSETLTIKGDDSSFLTTDRGAEITLSDGTRNTLILDSNQSGRLLGSGGSYIDMRNSEGDQTLFLDADVDDHPQIELSDVHNQTALLLSSDDGVGGAGNVRVFDADGDATIELQGAESAGTGGQIIMRDAAGNQRINLDSDFNGYSMLEMYNETGVETVEIRGSEGAPDGGQIVVRKADGTASIVLDAELGAGGDGRVTTEELQITGGSDLAEQFDIQPAGGTVEPGMVVSIDPEQPGQLRVCRKAYDRTVAGVVSGAGGVKPGMLMGQAGTTANGDHPVALTGRVYCWCDASAGAIEPGDLLTTSDVPGHAMKVADHANAHGAILGKAMTGLPEGRGLVLVLVALH